MTILFALLGWGAEALAQEPAERPAGFVEVLGGYGFQLGTTPYVPDEGEFKHPMTNGPAAGGAVGLGLTRTLFVLADYEYVTAWSRQGAVEGALDSIDAQIDYHTVTAGLRTVCGRGPGRVFGELAAGVVLPFQTEVEYDYASPLSQLPTPIEGIGRRTDEYGLGVGGHGAMGYQRLLGDRVYVSGLLKLRTFSTTNSGQQTVLDNYVRDLRAIPPTAENAKIEYAPDGEQPSTYSVQDARVQIAIGTYF